MIKQYTLTAVYRNNTSKDGKPLISKQGKPYQKVSIKTVETGNEYVKGFGAEWNKDWKAGDEVTLDIFTEVYNGKNYLKFKQVSMTDMLMEMVTELNRRVGALEYSWKTLQEKGYAYPTEEAKQPNFDQQRGDEPPIESFDDDMPPEFIP